MDRVTVKLVGALEIKVDKQRLDSTHIFSDMARFGRTRLMGVTVKRFLTQLKRHNRADYDMLEESLRKRYEPGETCCSPAAAQTTNPAVFFVRRQPRICII